MDSFQGTDKLTIQPNDRNVPVFLKLNAASASTANDGSMPYGSSVVEATVTAHTTANVDVSTDVISSSTESGNTIVTYIDYSTAVANKMCHLQATVSMTLTGSTLVMVREYDFDRLYFKSDI